MFKIFISNATRESILSREENLPQKSNLYQMLKWNHGSLVEELNDAAMEEYKNNPEKVLDNPSSLYILDMSEKEAENIQENYGVACVSSKNPNVSSLIDINDLFTPDKETNLFDGWDKVLDNVEGLPSNALLITDRYLFKTNRPDLKDGFRNIEQILDQLMPSKFIGGEYHVTIVFCRTSSSYKFSKIVEELDKIKNKLENQYRGEPGRKYNIKMEVLGIEKDKCIYYDLHPRRIISNYYYVQADYKLAAFKKDYTGTVEQDIIPMTLFTESGLTGSSSLPLRSINQTITVFKDFQKTYCDKTFSHPEEIYSYALNGKILPCCLGLKNRLLK